MGVRGELEMEQTLKITNVLSDVRSIAVPITVYTASIVNFND